MALRQLIGLGSRALQVEARTQGGQLRSFSLEQQRTAVSIDVVNNQVDRALKQLRRKLVEEGMAKQWKAQEVRTACQGCLQTCARWGGAAALRHS